MVDCGACGGAEHECECEGMRLLSVALFGSFLKLEKLTIVAGNDTATALMVITSGHVIT